ncbi:MAG TPA: nucleotidyltransferase family protein, partial [Candidatus Dormibacteraeota bacterium]|nr:nucleotidyltransferase family protein [Candidatus Dormibacteraeota bacterium]
MSSTGLVLAAGSSRRMGSPKQLLQVRGKPLLELVVGQACDSSLDDVLVVLGAAADEIRGRVDFGRARVLVNPDHAAGMASSLKAGLASLARDVDRAVVILGDQPDVDAALLNRLLELEETSGLPAAALSFNGLLHPPVVLKRELWGDLMTLEGDVGCRAVIRARPELVARLPVETDLTHPVDVDTPA